jgi:hypothetical protein
MNNLILISVLLLLIAAIIFPEFLNKVLYFRIPPELRIDANRHVPAASIALLMFGIFFFDSLHRDYPRLFRVEGDTAVVVSRYAAGIFFGSFGMFCCLKPARALKVLIWQLRASSISSIAANPVLTRFARLVGVAQLIGASCCLFRIME